MWKEGESWSLSSKVHNEECVCLSLSPEPFSRQVNLNKNDQQRKPHNLLLRLFVVSNSAPVFPKVRFNCVSIRKVCLIHFQLDRDIAKFSLFHQTLKYQSHTSTHVYLVYILYMCRPQRIKWICWNKEVKVQGVDVWQWPPSGPGSASTSFVRPAAWLRLYPPDYPAAIPHVHHHPGTAPRSNSFRLHPLTQSLLQHLLLVIHGIMAGVRILMSQRRMCVFAQKQMVVTTFWLSTG